MTSLYVWSGPRSARWAQWLLPLTAGGVVLWLGRGLWLGSWKVALDWGTGTLLLVGPVCAGASALVYSTMRARRWDDLMTGMRRGWVSWLGPLLGAWAIGYVTMLACTGAAVGTASWLGATASPRMLWALPLLVPTLAAMVSIGAVIGVNVPPLVSVPMAVVATFMLGGLSHTGTLPGVFRTGGVSGPLAAETYELRVLVAQSVICAAIASGCALSLAFHVFPVRSWVGAVAVAACFACAVPPWLALESSGYERYVFEGQPRLVCAGSVPAVCLSTDTVRPLRALAGEMRRQAAPLTELGISLPERFVQNLPGAARPGDGLVIFIDDGATDDAANPLTVSLALATPTACPQLSSDHPPLRALRARALLADWIATTSDVTGIGVSPTSAEGRWLRLPLAEQAEWLRPAYAALRGCRFGDLTMPF